MKTITDAKKVYSWLRERADMSKTHRLANTMFMTVYDAANEDFETGNAMAGLDLELWVHITEAAAGHPAYAPANVAVPEPVAVFVGDLLADLAYRGSSDSVSIEQAILMMICALDWIENFEHKPSTHNRAGVVKTRPAFEEQHQVSLSIIIPAGVGDDLHFSFRS